MEKIKLILKTNKSLTGTLLFAAFVLLQFLTLRFANQAGQCYLSAEVRELVYLFIQVAVIAGFLLFALPQKFIGGKKAYKILAAAVPAVCAAGAEIMLFAYSGTLFYLIVSAITVLCLGFIIGAVYRKLSDIIAGGAKAGMCAGIGYSSAVALQYVFQLQWTITPVLAGLSVPHYPLRKRRGFFFAVFGKLKKFFHLKNRADKPNSTLALLRAKMFYVTFIMKIQPSEEEQPNEKALAPVIFAAATEANGDKSRFTSMSTATAYI